MDNEKAPPEVHPRIKKLNAYRQGREAWLKGLSESDCPYPIRSGDNRMAWWCGWLDAKYSRLLGASLR